jgi:transcriptional regulator EpsA
MMESDTAEAAFDTSLSIPAREAEGLLRLIEAAPGVRRRYQFFVWLQTHVHLLLPHAVAVCGAYRRQLRDLDHEVFHGVVLDEALLGQLAGPASLPMAQVAERWLDSAGSPLVLSLAALVAEAHPGPAAAWQALAAGGLGHVLVHGVTRPDRPREIESLFAFFHAGPVAAPVRTYYLELLVPHLHSVYLRVQNVERGLGGTSTRQRSASAVPAAAQWNVTEREREILCWVREGRSNQQIGEQLGISPLTVKNHIQKILRKMGAANRAQAVSLAITAGMLPDPGRMG